MYSVVSIDLTPTKSLYESQGLNFQDMWGSILDLQFWLGFEIWKKAQELAHFCPNSISTVEDKYTPAPSPRIFRRALSLLGTTCDLASDFLRERSQILQECHEKDCVHWKGSRRTEASSWAERHICCAWLKTVSGILSAVVYHGKSHFILYNL